MSRWLEIGAAAGLAAALLVSPARAQPPPDEATQMRDFFANTLQIDVPDGQWSAKRYLSPDHTYREIGSDGEVHGTWSIEGGKICAAQDHPPAGQLARYCNVGVGKKVGEVWNDADPVTGNTVVFGLTPGR